MPPTFAPKRAAELGERRCSSLPKTEADRHQFVRSIDENVQSSQPRIMRGATKTRPLAYDLLT